MDAWVYIERKKERRKKEGREGKREGGREGRTEGSNKKTQSSENYFGIEKHSA